MTPTLRSLITSILAIVGASLVSRGILTEAGLETLIGALVAIVGVVWDAVSARAAQANVEKVQQALPPEIPVNGNIDGGTVNAILTAIATRGRRGHAAPVILFVICIVGLILTLLPACTTPKVALPVPWAGGYIEASARIDYRSPDGSYFPDISTLADK